MNGRIVKALSGFYYVRTAVGNVYECRAKGAFKNEGVEPLVGDNVVFNVTDAREKTGIVNEIEPRKNRLIRPSVANVDQVLVMFSVRNPTPNLSVLDKFLVLMQRQNIPTIIVFNKKDLQKGEDVKNLKKAYKKSGCRVMFTTLGGVNKDGKIKLFPIKHFLKGKITVLTGPSGTGKSTLINILAGNNDAEDGQVATVGAISSKVGRGKQTTRHNELFSLGHNEKYRVIDTPGFSSLLVTGRDCTREELQYAFPEFAEYRTQCPFADCSHIKERDCAVRKAAEDGKISMSRYNSYKSIYGDIKTR